MSSDVTEAVTGILEEADVETEEATVRAVLRRAGYLWQCGHCGDDTVKPDEEAVPCEGCGLSSEPTPEPQWQVHIVNNDPWSDPHHYGYGDDAANALAEAVKAARLEQEMPEESQKSILRQLEDRGADRRDPRWSVRLREVVYHGPKDGRARIGYVLRGERDVSAYAAKDHQDERGYLLAQEDNDSEAYQAVQDEFDHLGPFRWRL